MSEFSGLDTPLQEFLAGCLANWARRQGGRVEVTSVRRSYARQRRLYEDFKAGRSKYPAAPPGTSTHEKGLAFDLHVEPRALLDRMGSLWEKIGFTWGGRFHDPIHFDFRQRAGGPSRGSK